MNLSTLAKYVAGGVLIGSVFFLVFEGKVTSEQYMTIVTAGLTALGIHASRA